MEYRTWYFKIEYAAKDGSRKVLTGNFPYKKGDSKLDAAKFAKILFKEKDLGTFVKLDYVELR